MSLPSLRKLAVYSAELACSQLSRSLHASGRGSLKRELEERSLLYQVTDDALLERLEKGGEVVYLGIDPTADSLHIGHLKPISCLAHILLRGNRGILLIGGATARIGDPSGRESERSLLAPETTRFNSTSIAEMLCKITRSLGVSDRVTLVNNEDWYENLNILDFFSQVGPSLRLSAMLGKDSVKSRLRVSNGLSYQEFSYQAFQAYDFYQLNRRYGCATQLGGADQWGNITAGCDLVRKLSSSSVYGLTTQLLVDSQGNKLGKSIGGYPGSTLWLSSSKTSPFTLYQSFLRLDDVTCLQMIRQFLPLPLGEVELIEREHSKILEKRVGQRKLASDVTRMVHGDEELKFVEMATRLAFENFSYLEEMQDGEISGVIRNVPHVKLSLQQNAGLSLKEILLNSGHTPNLEMAQTACSQSLRVNGMRMMNADEVFTPDNFVRRNLSIFKTGKIVTFVLWKE